MLGLRRQRLQKQVAKIEKALSKQAQPINGFKNTQNNKVFILKS